MASKDPMWKTKLAEHIIECAAKKENDIKFYIRNGKVVIEEVTGGYMGVPMTTEEIQTVSTATTPPELWWCRAVAKQQGLSIAFMDWYWWDKNDLMAPKEVRNPTNEGME